MTVQDVLAILDGIAAFGLAENWDNVGLLVGAPGTPVNNILVALDPTEALLDEALETGADCIVTHHPLIFQPIRAIHTDGPQGRFLQRALERNVAVIGCHTNLDQAAGGVNDVLAESLGLRDIKPIAATESDAASSAGEGFGRIGSLAEPAAPAAFVAGLCDFFKLPGLRIAGRLPEKIRCVAVCGGSGSDLARTAFGAGAQVYITGEVKHSTARWAEEAGFCIIDAGHFATENPVVATLAGLLQQRLAQKGCAVRVALSKKQRDPFTYHQPGG